MDRLEAPKFSLVFVFYSSLMLLCMQDLVIPPLVLFSMLLITTRLHFFFHFYLDNAFSCFALEKIVFSTLIFLV